jgi:hypothetical protein
MMATKEKSADKALSSDEIFEKGGGTIVRVGNVWTYPGCPMDNSGTNLRLPIESIPHDDVQAWIRDGDVLPAALDHNQRLVAVRQKPADPEAPSPPVLLSTQAGTPEAGTELPIGSHPALDAGRRAVSPAEAALAATKSMLHLAQPHGLLTGGTAGGGVEGAETGKQEPSISKEPTQEQTGARKGR